MTNNELTLIEFMHTHLPGGQPETTDFLNRSNDPYHLAQVIRREGWVGHEKFSIRDLVEGIVSAWEEAEENQE